MKRIWDFFSYLFNPRTSGQVKKLIEGDEGDTLSDSFEQHPED